VGIKILLVAGLDHVFFLSAEGCNGAKMNKENLTVETQKFQQHHHTHTLFIYYCAAHPLTDPHCTAKAVLPSCSLTHSPMDPNGNRGAAGETISESIKVFCRVRPDTPDEPAETSEEDNIYLTGSSNDQESGGNRIGNIDEEGNQCTYVSSSGSAKTEQTFKMDGFFGPDTTQEKVSIR
jgi:hypothetical protein